MTQIIGKNFVLRRIKKSDFKSWSENIIDDDIQKNFVSNPRNLKEARKEFNSKFKNNTNSDDFIIDIDGCAIGEIGLHNIIPRLSAKVDYWIGKKHRGKGIMADALRLLIKYSYSKHRLVRIYAQPRTFNKSSCRVLEKLGFKLEGIKRKDVLKNGKYYDNYLYAKVR